MRARGVPLQLAAGDRLWRWSEAKRRGQRESRGSLQLSLPTSFKSLTLPALSLETVTMPGAFSPVGRGETLLAQGVELRKGNLEVLRDHVHAGKSWIGAESGLPWWRSVGGLPADEGVGPGAGMAGGI